MYERTRFGTTPHSQKVVQDSDAYIRATDGKIKAPTAVEGMWLVGLGILVMRPMASSGARRTMFNGFNVPDAVGSTLADI